MSQSPKGESRMSSQGPFEIILKDAEQKSDLRDLGKTDGKETGGKEPVRRLLWGRGKKTVKRFK